MELYEIKVHELDEQMDYSMLELSGLTGLGQDTIRSLINQGKFTAEMSNGSETVNGGEFLRWSRSVNNKIHAN